MRRENIVKKPYRTLFAGMIILLMILIQTAFPVTAGAAQTGWKTKGGKVRYLTANGYIKDKVVRLDGKYYYFDKNGYRKTGWVKWNRHRYFFGKKDGAAYTGARTIKGSLYLFRSCGTLITRPKRRTLNGKIYVLDSNAHAFEVQKGLLSTELLKAYGIGTCRRLMIVAHPDDEYFWGGAHLAKYHDFFVVCLTFGDNAVRKEEFRKALKETNNHGIILTYPAKEQNGERSTWEGAIKPMMRDDLWTLLECKKWDQIVTHNPEGEYGHNQHKLTNVIVTDVCDAYGVKGSLYYFGRFYFANRIDPKQKKFADIRISKSQQQIKDHVLRDIYVSQRFSYTSLGHMIPYEGWVRADNWK